ncbi:MAG: acyltransferase [Acidobacteriota bacterium]
MVRRFVELDSLRGLAALAVVINHHLNVLPQIFDQSVYARNDWVVAALKYTPLHAFWGGHEAVIFFFVISGFVLALPYFKRELHYKPFILKRICRIYLPYIVAVSVALLADVLVSRGAIAELSSWFNGAWTQAITPKMLINHALLIGSFSNGELDPVLWSLVHEMRVSLVFPVVVFVVTRFWWRRSLAVAVAVTLVAFVLAFAIYRGTGISSDVPATLHYMAMFIIGALLAKHHDALTTRFNRFQRTTKWLVLSGAILAYTYRWWFLPHQRVLHFDIFNDWAATAGVSVFIVCALASAKVSRLLHTRPLLFLGRISYSLYLYHAIVLLAALHLLFGLLPLTVIYAMSLIATILVSTAMYRLVEVPSIEIGRRWSSPRPRVVTLGENLQPGQI